MGACPQPGFFFWTGGESVAKFALSGYNQNSLHRPASRSKASSATDNRSLTKALAWSLSQAKEVTLAMTEPSSRGAARIGMQFFSSDPFWVLVGEGIYQRAEQLHLDLTPLGADFWSLSGDKQMEAVEEVLAQELHGLIAQAASPLLAGMIAGAGIPLVLLTENSIKHPLVTSPQGLYEVASIAARFIADRIERRGRVLVAGGLMEGFEQGQSRLRGFHSIMDDHPQIEIQHIPTPWSFEPALEQLLDALGQETRPFAAIFGLSDSTALAALHGARRLGLADERTIVVGVNGDPLALAAILDGSMAATVETSAIDLGRQAVDLVLAAVRGEQMPRYFSYKPRLVTRQNVAQVSTEKLAATASLPNRLVGINRHYEQERLVQLETSLEISRRVGSTLDHQQLYHEIVDLIRSNYGYDEAQIFVWSLRQREFILDRIGPEGELATRIPLARSGLLGHTLLQNRPTFVPDMRHSQRFPADPFWPATRARVILPIRQGSGIIGLLDLHSQQPIQHSSTALIGLQALADQLGAALRNVDLYQEAVAARADAERANQLKSRLLANVSHELRTPLNVIAGYSQAALARPDLYGAELPAALLKDLRHIFHNSQHLERLINDLLDLSKAEIGELEILPELLDARAVLVDAFESMAGRRRADAVEWRIHAPETLPTIYADPGRLRQILLNLLSNAGKFTAKGSITLGAQVEQDHLHIWVEDTGSGISPDLQERLLTAFSAIDLSGRSEQGIGLGLRVTDELVRLHNGRITLTSQPGIGSTFHVSLPLLNSETAAELPAPSVAAARGSSLSLHPDRLSPQVKPLTRQAVTYFCEYYGRALSRQEIAGSLGVTAGYLTRVFRGDLGMTPWEYLTSLRVAHAKDLLTDHRRRALSIAQVAGMVGYDDPAYFSRVFLKETGHSPREFRKLAQGG